MAATALGIWHKPIKTFTPPSKESVINILNLIAKGNFNWQDLLEWDFPMSY
jgi:hypothetical protein